MAVIEAERQVNSPLALHQRFLAGDEQLSAGQLTKIVHLLPREHQIEAIATIRTAQSAFWQEWSAFRGGLDYDGEPNFYHVVGRLPVLGQYAGFIDPRPGDVIVDLAGGSAAMAAYFDKSRIAGYITIDSNPLVQKKAREHLSRLGHPTDHVIEHDLTQGLPDGLKDRIAAVSPLRARFISNWGTGYFPIEPMARLYLACLDFETVLGIPSTVDFNILTNGKFDPEVLRKNFIKEVVPQHLMTLQIRSLFRAFRAMGPIIKFGRELPMVAPIWYREEIKELLTERGLEVIREDATLLWGQSTAMQVQRKVA